MTTRQPLKTISLGPDMSQGNRLPNDGSDERAEFKLVFDVLRLRRAPKVIRDLTWQLGLHLELEVEKSWLMETVRLRVEGSPANVSRFISEFQTIIQMAIGEVLRPQDESAG